MEDGKNVFRLRLRLCSSLYPINERIRDFFLEYDRHTLRTSPPWGSELLEVSFLSSFIFIMILGLVYLNSVFGTSVGTILDVLSTLFGTVSSSILELETIAQIFFLWLGFYACLCIFALCLIMLPHLLFDKKNCFQLYKNENGAGKP